MPVYAKTLTPEWAKAFEEFEQISGFEVMHQDEVDAGELTPQECWNENIEWLEGLLADVTHISTPFEKN